MRGVCLKVLEVRQHDIHGHTGEEVATVVLIAQYLTGTRDRIDERFKHLNIVVQDFGVLLLKAGQLMELSTVINTDGRSVIHLVPGSHLQRAGVSTNFHTDALGSATHSPDLFANLILNTGKVAIVVLKIPGGPQANQIVIPGTESKPTAHLQKSIIGLARPKVVRANQALKGQTTGESITADNDIGSRRCVVVFQSFF